MFKRFVASLVCLAFIFTNFQYVHAQDFSITQLPVPGSMIFTTPSYVPLTLKGLIIHPENALKFDFLMDTGHSRLTGQGLSDEALKIMKYFLTALTIPEDDLWVNLSPYEKGRIVQDNFGQTIMGRDLLAEDYILKQLTSSLIYPEKALGKEFWQQVYSKAAKEYGTTQISVNTFNKVWIVPSEAVVWEHDGKVLIVKSHLKVMLEEDYLSMSKHMGIPSGVTAQNPALVGDSNTAHSLASQIVRKIVLPVLEKEVNEGQNFAQLRQMFQAMILATWYKKALKTSILNKVYSNKKKTMGVEDINTGDIQSIYQQYLKAFKKGAFNYIKEEIDSSTGQTIPRKYFSGGLGLKTPLVTWTGELPATARQEVALAENPNGAMLSIASIFGLSAPDLDETAAEKYFRRFKINDVPKILSELDKPGYPDFFYKAGADQLDYLLRAGSNEDNMGLIIKYFVALDARGRPAELNTPRMGQALPVFYIDAILDRLKDPKYPDNFKKIAVVLLKARLHAQHYAGVTVIQKLAEMVESYGRQGEASIPDWLWEALGPYTVVTAVNARRNYTLSKKIKEILRDKDAPSIAGILTETGGNIPVEVQGDAFNEDEFDGSVHNIYPLLIRLSSFEFQAGDFEEGQAEQLIKDMIKKIKKDIKKSETRSRILALLSDKKVDAIAKLNAFIHDLDAWKVLGATRKLNPEETRAQLEEVYAQTPTRQSLVEKLFPNIRISVQKGLNDSIAPFKLFIKHAKENKAPIELSRLAITFTENTILNPYHPNTVWEYVSPTQRRLRPDITKEEEEKIAEIMETSQNKGEIEKILSDARKADLKKINPRVSDLITGFLRTKLGKYSKQFSDDTLMTWFLNYSDDRLRQLNEQSYKEEDRTVTLPGGRTLMIPGKKFTGKQIKRAMLEADLPSETPSVAAYDDTLKKGIIVLADQEKKLAILLEILKNPKLYEWAKEKIQSMPLSVAQVNTIVETIHKDRQNYPDDAVSTWPSSSASFQGKSKQEEHPKPEQDFRRKHDGTVNRLDIESITTDDALSQFGFDKVSRILTDNHWATKIDGNKILLNVKMTEQVTNEMSQKFSPNVWKLLLPILKIAADFAMDNTKTSIDNSALGGIALNAKLLDLQIKRDAHGVPLSLSQQSLDAINIRGFVPQIISIKPVDLPALFGINS